MKNRLSAAGATLLALLVAVLAFGQPAHAAAGFSVADGKLYDANGTEFVMRGVNHAHTWYPQQTSSFANIKALGANTVRVVLASGDRWTTQHHRRRRQRHLAVQGQPADLRAGGARHHRVRRAERRDHPRPRRRLLAQPRQTPSPARRSTSSSTSATSRTATRTTPRWATDNANAIKRLRAGGLTHTIMVDAPNWGQDWSFTMRDNAASVFAADPARNTVFSIHMYGVFDTAAEISDYLGRFRTAGLPIVVGEFGFNHSDGNPDEDAILAYSQANGIGYLGWSWSGNGGGVEYLDLATNFNPAQPDHLGSAPLQRRQRHPADRPGGQRLRRHPAADHPAADRPRRHATTPPPTTPPPTVAARRRTR